MYIIVLLYIQWFRARELFILRLITFSARNHDEDERQRYRVIITIIVYKSILYNIIICPYASISRTVTCNDNAPEQARETGETHHRRRPTRAIQMLGGPLFRVYIVSLAIHYTFFVYIITIIYYLIFIKSVVSVPYIIL